MAKIQEEVIKMQEIPDYLVINRARLQFDGNTYEFEGRQIQNTDVSFIWVDMQPGNGVRLHKHPYKEIFIVEKGEGTFTVMSKVPEAHAGQIVIVPADTAHKSIRRDAAIAAGRYPCEPANRHNLARGVDAIII